MLPSLDSVPFFETGDKALFIESNSCFSYPLITNNKAAFYTIFNSWTKTSVSNEIDDTPAGTAHVFDGMSNRNPTG